MSQLGRLPVGSLRALAVARVGVSDRRAQEERKMTRWAGVARFGPAVRVLRVANRLAVVGHPRNYRVTALLIGMIK
jgi:hypothetical protein